VAEAQVTQLPTQGADYSKYDTDHLKMLLRPGILHRNEARFKALIRKELQKREQQSQQGVADGSDKTFTVKYYSKKTGRNVTRQIKASSESELWDRLRAKGIDVVSIEEQGVAEGEVVPFRRSQQAKLTWQQLPKDVLQLANDWYWASEDDFGLDAVMDPEGYGSGTKNDVRYFGALLQQRGWSIDFNDEHDKPGESNLILKNKLGQSVLLPIKDAQNFSGWAQDTDGDLREQDVGKGAEEDSEKIKGFHQSLGNAIRGRVSQMQANMAILKAQHPDTWLWEPGDIVYSTKTGRTYKIVGPWIDSHGTAKYLYQGNDEEKGTFVADKAHKTLKKLSEDQGVAEGSEYTPPKLGTVKASIMNTTTPTVQIQVFKHNTLRGDSYWVTKQVKTFKTMDQAKAYVDRINKQGVAEGFTDDINLVYAMHPQPEESERVALGILDMDENEFIAAWQKLPAEYQEEFNFDLPLWNTDELKNYKHITLKVMKFADYVKLVEDYIRSQEMSQSAVSALKKGVAEGQVNEFAPDDTNDGIWYNDNKIAKIVGRWWLADDLLSNSSNIYMYGDEAKESATQEAEEQLREKGFYVNVLDVRENTKKENLDWLISGPLVRVHIGEQGITEATNRRKEATLRIQKMLNDKFNANLDVDGILGPLTIASINKFMPNAKVKLADEPNRTTAVQGNKMKKENVNLESRYGDQYNVNKTTSVSLAKELNDMVLELGELIAASPKHPSLDRLKDKIVALNQELNDLGYDYDPQAENFLTPITLDMRNLHEGICPKCKGSIVAEIMINEKQDSCYYKVKSRYKVWPSAYASGALVQCRKKGAKNWGKKNESKNVNENKIYFSIPKSLANETELRESFNLRHDAKGWYLKEGQENFKKSYKDALKAFPLYKDTSEGLDMSKGTGSAPIKGDDFVLSPVGSIPKNKK
jgi:hypothetical protein